MNKLTTIAAASILLATSLTSCQKEEITSAAPVAAVGKNMTETQNILRWMSENMQAKNLGNGAILVREDLGGFWFGISKNVVFDPETFTFLSGEFANFSAEPGTGDFKRYNPDGSVTIKLVSNAAVGGYENVVTGEVYAGPGKANFRFTGFEETFEVPFPPFTLTFIFPDPSANAFVVHGQSNNMTLNGEPGQTHRLNMWWTANPGGQGFSDFSFE